MKNDINMVDYLSLIKDRLDLNEIEYIVEVGSLDGKDSIFFKNNFPTANVYTIEGLEDNFNKYLKENKSIKPFNVVISDYIGTTNYYVKNTNGLHGIFNRGNQYGTKVVQLPCITLDKFCEDNNIPRIDIMKIDVEGATLNVLKGMNNILSKVKIMHIETESYPFFEGQTLHNDVVEYLDNNGFEMIKLSQVQIIKDKFQMDSVWINKELK